MTTTKPTDRQPLSKERIITAAVEFVDEAGIDALSMRKLGTILDVQAMSLYNHVANRDDLVAGMVDAIYGEVDLPDVDEPWRAGLRRIAMDTRDALLAHPWVCNEVYSSMVGPHRIAHMEAMLGLMRTSGFSVEATHHGFHALSNHVVGHAMQTSAFTYDAEDLDELGARFLEWLPQDEYPYLTEHVRYHTEPGSDETTDFVLVLDMILEGLEALRESERSA